MDKNINDNEPSLLKGTEKVVMLVGGTDSSGGAGLSADIATCRLLQTYPMPVVSCVTSQSSKGFRSMQVVDLDIFQDQLESVLTDVRPDAVKIGLLPSGKHMQMLAEMLVLYPHGPVVFDPIMAPTLGADNYSGRWIDNPNALTLLMSQVHLMTPNADELQQLVEPIKASGIYPPLSGNLGELDERARKLLDMHILRLTYDLRNLLLTGGHNSGDDLHTDLLLCSKDDLEVPIDFDMSEFNGAQRVDREEEELDETEESEEMDARDEAAEDDAHPVAYEMGILKGEVVDTPNTHGTGCVYASAIAAFLAQGMKLQMAVPLAKQVLTMLLKSGQDWRLYKEGHGPAFSKLAFPHTANDTPSPLRDITRTFMN